MKNEARIRNSYRVDLYGWWMLYSIVTAAIKGKQIKRAIAEEANRKSGRKMRICKSKSDDGCSADQLLFDGER